MKRVLGVFALACLAFSVAQAQETQTYVEYGRTSTPPSSTDYNMRQLWRAGRHFLRIEYPQDRSGNSTTKIYNGLDLYTSTTRPPTVKHTRTREPDGEPHAFILARGGPKDLMALEIGNEVEFFKKHNAARGPDERPHGFRCAVYTLDIKPYHLILYVNLDGSGPRELFVKTPEKEYTIKYNRYNQDAPFYPIRFEPPTKPLQEEDPRADSGPGGPSNEELDGPGRTVRKMAHKISSSRENSPPDHPQIVTIVWDRDALKETLKRLKPGDSIQFTNHQKKISFTWKATKGYLASFAAIADRNFEEALPLTRAEAKHGDALAQYDMATLAIHGATTREEAVEWLAKSRKQGFVLATSSLGIALKTGEGVARDSAKALELFQEAAKQDCGEAEFSMGLNYLYDDNIDETLGLEWMQKAADHGYGMAAAIIKGFPEEKRKAQAIHQENMASIKLLQNAAAQGDARAETALGTILLGRRGVPRDVKKAIEWYTKAAAHGEVEAMIPLGLFHLDGNGIKKDPVVGLKYIQAAIDKGFGPAAAVLSSLYHLGHGVRKDDGESRANFKHATELCHPDELIGSGIMLLQGDNVPRDETTGLGLITFSADKGFIPAQSLLGDYYKNTHSRENTAKALQWHLKAAEQGYMPSQLTAANLYRGTPGVRMDWVKAKHWLEKAAEQGSEEAANKLKALKADSGKQTTHFKAILPLALAGQRRYQTRIMEVCMSSFDVPIGESADGQISAFVSKEFSAGPDSVKKNPQLAECLRRVEKAEAQTTALED